MAAVAANDESGVDVDWAGRSVSVDADDPMVAVFDEANGLVFHEKAERGEICSLGREEVEEVPLGHKGDELGVSGQVGEIRYGEGFATDSEDKVEDLLVGKSEEGFEDAELIEELESGGMDRVATEVTKEVLVLFKDGDFDSGAGEEETEHDACGASADDAAGSF